MLRVSLTERPSFRFRRRSHHQDQKKSKLEVGETSTATQIQARPPTAPQERLPRIRRLNTESFLDLFQAQSNSAVLNEKNGEKEDVTCPLDAGTQSSLSATQPRDNSPVSLFDAGSFDIIPCTMATRLTSRLSESGRIEAEDNHSATSSPSSGFRVMNDSSHCSRKSSTSSVGSPLPYEGSSFDGRNAIKGSKALHEDGDTSLPQPLPQLDKPLPPPPPPSQRPFSVSSVLSVMRADSISKGCQPPITPPGAGISIRQQLQLIPVHELAHRKSVSMGLPPTHESSVSRKTKRGARLGKAINQGQLRHKRSQSLKLLSSCAVKEPNGQPGRHGPPPMVIFLQTTSDPVSSIGDRKGIAEEKLLPSVSADVAERIILKIMRNLDDPADLLATARLNRGFYMTYRRREPQLVDSMLRRISLPAWEFQKNSSHATSQPLSLRAYTRDKAALGFVKSTLLSSNKSDLRPETLAGLTGIDKERSARVDRALWRIWTFCKGFGHRALHADGIKDQVDWLNGGSRIARKLHPKTVVGAGNGKGVSKAGLEDMLEIWEGLGRTLSGFGQRLPEARAAGIFDKCKIDASHTEGWFLEEWIHYVRSLGLPTVLSLSSSLSFEQAAAAGFTEWTPPAHDESRSTFLKSAIVSAYEERVISDAALIAAGLTLPPKSLQRHSYQKNILEFSQQSRRPVVDPQPTQLPGSPALVRRKALAPSPSINTDDLNPRWEPETPDTPLPQQAQDIRQPDFSFSQHELQRDSMGSPIRTSCIHSLGIATTASTRLGATLFPMEYPSTPHIPRMLSSSAKPKPQSTVAATATDHETEPQIVDPVDKAMALLVNDLGFSHADASSALARCDTGFGVDVQRAIGMLTQESGRHLAGARPNQISNISGPSSPSTSKGQREYCQGHPERNPRGDPAISGASLRDTYPVRQPSLRGSLGPSLSVRLSKMTSKAKTYKALRLDIATKGNKVISTEEDRPVRLTSVKVVSTPEGDEARTPFQLLPDRHRIGRLQASRVKRARKLVGIEEEPGVTKKALQATKGGEHELRETSLALTEDNHTKKRFYDGFKTGWVTSSTRL